MRYFVTLPGCDEIAVDVVQRPGGQPQVRVADQPVEISAQVAQGALCVLVDGHVVDLWADDDGRAVHFSTGCERARALVEDERARLGAAASRRGGGGGGNVTAPMPGRVVKLLVAEGEVVAAGAPVVVVEAMKMENELCGAGAGRVKKIHVSAGQNVEGGALLVELSPLDEGAPP